MASTYRFVLKYEQAVIDNADFYNFKFFEIIKKNLSLLAEPFLSRYEKAVAHSIVGNFSI